ncbi:MAG: RNA polymerase sigma factor RpoD [Candidatus Omnitrophica bacterium]|nr:RNA polymerase sigma factor RpoD [Candidatus Omnitrophota bacterium]
MKKNIKSKIRPKIKNKAKIKIKAKVKSKPGLRSKTNIKSKAKIKGKAKIKSKANIKNATNKRTNQLIREGKKKGHLTYEEIQDILPEEVISPQDVDDILSTLDELHIEIVSSTEEFRKKKELSLKKTTPQIERAKFSDPVRAYLHQMGRIPLLLREEEIYLAKNIEEGSKSIKKVLKKLIADDIFAWTVKKKNLANLVHQLKNAMDKEARGLLPTGFMEREWEIKKKDFQKHLPLLLQEAKKVRMSKEKMIQSNLRLVVSIAKKYIHRGLSLLDLIQEGNMGLMRAVDKFEYKRGYKFSTYATWWIRQAITRAIADQARTIRIPVHMIETINRLSRITQKFVQKSGRGPTTEELSQKMKLSLDKVRAVLKISQHPISLETPIGADETSHFGDFIEDKDVIMPDTTAAFSMLKEQIGKVLDTLPEREKDILRLRFGIGEGISPHTLEEVGKKFNVTRERVRQIEAKALNKLRHPAKSKSLRGHLE